MNVLLGIPLVQVAAVYVAIESSCPSCTLSGSGFMFMAGYSYTIVLVTSTNQAVHIHSIPVSYRTRKVFSLLDLPVCVP